MHSLIEVSPLIVEESEHHQCGNPLEMMDLDGNDHQWPKS